MPSDTPIYDAVVEYFALRERLKHPPIMKVLPAYKIEDNTYGLIAKPYVETIYSDVPPVQRKPVRKRAPRKITPPREVSNGTDEAAREGDTD